MKREEVEYYLYSILSGKVYLSINEKSYISIPNTVDEIYRGNLIYRSVMDDIKYDDVMNWDEAQIVSARLGYWTPQDEASLKQLETMLENTKLELFLSYVQLDKVKRLKKQIRSLENGINKSYINKYTMFDITKESIAQNMKEAFLFGVSIIDSSGKKVYDPDDFHNWDDYIISKFKNYVIDNHIDPKDIRYMARVEPFRGMWMNCKENIFDKVVASEWTANQKLLASFSRMYDNVYESMECPEDVVIEDDDMLDGWFIKQRKDREKRQKEKNLDDRFGKVKDNAQGQEVFIMANNPYDAKDIYNINDAGGRATIKNRNNQIQNNEGATAHGHLKDVQMDLRMQAVQETKAHFRKGK
jgi:hypothetical protein